MKEKLVKENKSNLVTTSNISNTSNTTSNRQVGQSVKKNVYKAVQASVTHQIEKNKVTRELQEQFVLDQTLMGVGLQLAITKAAAIFEYTRLNDRNVVSAIRTSAVKLLKLFKAKLRIDVNEYEKYLAEASTYLEHLCTIGFGVKTEHRPNLLAYLAKLRAWMYAQDTGKKDNFLFIEAGSEIILMIDVYGEDVSVVSVGLPSHGDRVLLAIGDGVLAWYDSFSKTFSTENGEVLDVVLKDEINDIEGTKWLSITELTKTL